LLFFVFFLIKSSIGTLIFGYFYNIKIIFISNIDNLIEFVFFSDEIDACSLAQCGANARCIEQNSATICQCAPDYYGNPYVACHYECLQNSDCNLNEACSNHKCISPCEGACGSGASCDVINHSPICYCDAESTGNPFVYCTQLPYGKFRIK
jgi:hypothetical protein